MLKADVPGHSAVPSRSGEIAVLRWLDTSAEAVVVAALLAELVLVLANVVARIYFQHSFLWTDEVARLALSILAFIGGAVGVALPLQTSWFCSCRG